MIPKSELKNIVHLQHESVGTEKSIRRGILKRIRRQTDFVTIITGVRRAGKSTLLKQLMAEYDRCHYLNFEDFRLSGFQQADFNNLDAVLSEMNPHCDVYFFDEIQIAPGWENYVRTLNDTKKTVYLTGSNASLLSGESGTKLTGRHLDYELFPMDFFEYCTLKRSDISNASMDEYLVKGGFPQYLKTEIEEFLQQILSDILYRDIIKRHSIRSIAVLEDLTRYLVSNISKEYSLRNISKMLNTFSIHTLSEFLSYMEDAYLFFSVPIFSYSLKKQAVNPRKIYSVDNGLSCANSRGFTKDKGKLLENLVFLALRRNFKEIFYFKKTGECDFLVKDKNEVHTLIQVCYEINSENIARELRGLEEAMIETGCKNACIVTFKENSTYDTKTGKVAAVSAIEWLKKFQ